MSLYDNDREKKQHSDAISAISTQYGVDASVIKQIYETHLAMLKNTAKIKTYLSVLTIRAVKDHLHESGMIDEKIEKPELVFH